MKNYPIDKYRFYDAGNKIIAVSTYAGKQVRGVAICHPDDEFDIETGKKIAAARCNYRIANKRYERAQAKYAEAQKQLISAQQYLDKMKEYMTDSFLAANEAAQFCDNIIKEIA
ncbi:MAG: hypothetical protein IKR04_04725 [Clostridia bacterium]|nr:hypothetical protein [Clostridia bacterium]